MDPKKVDYLSPLEVYSCKIYLGDIKKTIIKIIDIEGDKQNQSTNIKADMTDWRLNYKYDAIKLFSKNFIDIYKKILQIYNPEFYKIMTNYYRDDDEYFNHIVNIWGARYRSGEKTVPHDHLPSRMSFCLYLKTPKGCPGLSFTDINKTLPIEEGMLLLFNGAIRHSVKSKKFRGTRYVLAGNFDPTGVK